MNNSGNEYLRGASLVQSTRRARGTAVSRPAGPQRPDAGTPPDRKDLADQALRRGSPEQGLDGGSVRCRRHEPGNRIPPPSLPTDRGTGRVCGKGRGEGATTPEPVLLQGP